MKSQDGGMKESGKEAPKYGLVDFLATLDDVTDEDIEEFIEKHVPEKFQQSFRRENKDSQILVVALSKLSKKQRGDIMSLKSGDGKEKDYLDIHGAKGVLKMLGVLDK